MEYKEFKYEANKLWFKIKESSERWCQYIEVNWDNCHFEFWVKWQKNIYESVLKKLKASKSLFNIDHTLNRNEDSVLIKQD